MIINLICVATLAAIAYYLGSGYFDRIEKDGYQHAVNGGCVGDCPYSEYEVYKRASWIKGHCAGWAIYIKNNRGN